jgi:hypothetical protein
VVALGFRGGRTGFDGWIWDRTVLLRWAFRGSGGSDLSWVGQNLLVAHGRNFFFSHGLLHDMTLPRIKVWGLEFSDFLLEPLMYKNTKRARFTKIFT